MPMERVRGMAFPNVAGPPAVGTGNPAQAAATTHGTPTGGFQPQTARGHQPGARGVLPGRQLLPRERLRGIAAPYGPGPPARGMGSTAQVVVCAYGVPKGDCSPQHRGPTGWGSPAQAVVAAYGALVGDAGSQRRAPTGSGDGEPCQIGGSGQWNAYGWMANPNMAGPSARGRGCLPRRCSLPAKRVQGMADPTIVGASARGVLPRRWLPTDRLQGMAAPNVAGPWLGGRGVLPGRWLATECLRGTAAPNGAGQPARGRGSPAQAAAGAYGAPIGDDRP